MGMCKFGVFVMPMEEAEMLGNLSSVLRRFPFFFFFSECCVMFFLFVVSSLLLYFLFKLL